MPRGVLASTALAINSEFGTAYLRQCFVGLRSASVRAGRVPLAHSTISQRWIRIASFFRLALTQIFGTEIHCYMRNAVLERV